MSDANQNVPPQIIIENRRQGVGRIVRLVYAVGVIGLAFYFGYQLVTPIVFLEGPGLVTAKRHHVALPYIAHIEHMNVIAGIAVREGDEIATVYAPDVSREISGLLAASTELSIREGQLNITVSVAESSLEPAAARLRAAREAEKRLNEAAGNSYSLGYRADVMREAVDAVRLNTEMISDLLESKRQLSIIRARRNDIEAQIERIQSNYNEGSVVARETGVVSARLATVGSIILPGVPIAEILNKDDMFIEWYLPSLQFREPARGDRVYVSSGKKFFEGTVAEVLPISASMPSSSAPLLRMPNQGQMARVKLDQPTDELPFDSEVTIRMNYLHFVDDLINKFKS